MAQTCPSEFPTGGTYHYQLPSLTGIFVGNNYSHLIECLAGAAVQPIQKKNNNKKIIYVNFFFVSLIL